jgi:drug/metabolite transporter (DMT)-like permease
MSDTTRGYLLALAGVVIFGLTLPFTRIAVAELPPVFVGLGRAIVAALIAAVMLAMTRSPRPIRRDILKLLVAGFGIVIGFPVFSAIAMQTAPASHGGVVLGILPLATAAAAMVFAGERPSARFWVWAVAGSAAVVTFALLNAGATEVYTADLWLLAAIVAAAIGYAISGDMTKRLGGWQVISWCLIVMLPVIIVPVMFTLPHVNWGASAWAWALVCLCRGVFAIPRLLFLEQRHGTGGRGQGRTNAVVPDLRDAGWLMGTFGRATDSGDLGLCTHRHVLRVDGTAGLIGLHWSLCFPPARPCGRLLTRWRFCWTQNLALPQGGGGVVRWGRRMPQMLLTFVIAGLDPGISCKRHLEITGSRSCDRPGDDSCG